jgi:tRNA(fMet)-specific endonuclease VapC
VYVLKTDIVSKLLDTRRTTTALRERIRSEPLDDLAISVVTVEEVLRGTLEALRRSQMKSQYVVEAYEELRLVYGQLYRLNVLPFTNDAEKAFHAIPQSIRRSGVNYCCIAAIGIAHGCTVVTANTQHFNKIPGLTIEDWTRE